MVEAAKVDGAGDFCIYYKIMIPMAKPLIATLGLFTALAYWNDWYNCMLFINDNRFRGLKKDCGPDRAAGTAASQ